MNTSVEGGWEVEAGKQGEEVRGAFVDAVEEFLEEP